VEKRTASNATSGQIKDLAVTVAQGVPADLPEEIARGHLARKSNVHKWIQLGLAHNLSQIDFSLVEAVLEGRLELRFSQSTRQRLEEDGWRITSVTEGITLDRLAKKYLNLGYPYPGEYKGEVEAIPTKKQEVAWYPPEPMWPITRSKTLIEAKEILSDRVKKEVKYKYGSEVRVLFPTLELVAFLVCLYFKDKTYEPFIDATWTRNGVTMGYAFFLSKHRPSSFSMRADSFEGGLGVFRLIEPSF
jgi:hypothetical protein